MLNKNRLLNSFLSVLLVISLTLMNVHIALADDGPTPEPALTAEPTEPPVQPTEPPVEATEPAVLPTEPPVIATQVPTEAPVVVEETPDIVEPAPIVDLLTQAPDNTELVVLDENGEALPLTSQEALNTILETDPMWCPAGVLPGGAGCTTNFGSINLLITDMVNNTTTYDENGIIYFTTNPGASFSLTTASLGAADFNTLNDFNLTLQGGWNGSNGASATFTGQTNFAANTITIGSLVNPWIGNLTLNNFSFSGVSSSNAITIYTTTGNITLDNVDVAQQTGDFNTALINSASGNITVQNGSTFDGNNAAPPTNGQSIGFSATTGTGSITISDTTFQESRQNGNNTYDGATLSAPIVTLTNVIAQNNDGDGITINNVNVVTLNNVTANNNGTASGGAGLTGNDGSGVFVNGNSGSSVIIIGGTFTGNQEYGVEVANPANTTIYIQSNPTCTGNASNSAPPLGVSSCYNDTTIFDNTAPVITPTISGTVGSNGWYTSNVTVSWTVVDSESGIASSTGCTTANLNSDTIGTSITCSASNNAGLSSSNSVTVKIDKTSPTAVLTVIAGTAGNNGWYTSDVTIQTVGTDSTSSPVTCTANQFQTAETAGTAFNGSCTNNAGLTTLAIPLTIKLDKTNPLIAFVNSTPSPNANGWINSDVTVNWSCTDGLSGPVSAAISQTISTEGTNQSATGTCQDLAGNSASDTQSGFNIDKTDPTLNLPADMIVEATSSSGATVNYSASATDNLDAAPSFSCIPASGSNFVMGTTMVNCSATDHADNVAFGNFNVTVQDTTGPVIAFHADITAEATSAAGAVVNYTSPATSDAVDGAGVATCLPSPGTFPLGNTTITCTATDLKGNLAIPTTFVIHVVDTTAPVIAAHLDITAEATSAAGAVVSYSIPTTSDAVDGPGIATCQPASGTTFALGDTTVTCDATDAHNNAAVSTTFVVHVVDTTAPVIAPHGDITAEATSAAGAVVNYTSPATSDIVDGAGTATCSPASGTTFALGNTTVTCNATDAHNNSAIPTSFVIHVVDTTAPIIAAHADVFVAATSPAGAIVNYTSPSTSDAVDGPGVATCVPPSGSTFNLGNTTVTCNATDAHGNAAIPTTFVVHVIDTVAPVIDGHLDVTVEATSAAGAIATYTSPSTTDAVDGVGVANCLPASGTFFSFGNTTVTCNATDSNGNAATPTTFVVHVVDTTAPVIAGHADITIETTSSSGASVTYTSPATSDTVDGAGLAACSPASGGLFPVGDTVVTCNATDAHGNSAQPVTFTVHVDLTPVSQPPSDPQSSQGNGGLSIPVTGAGLLNLDCLTTFLVSGVKVTFYNLCDYQSLISGVEADTLPAALPDGYSFVKGLNVPVFLNQQEVKPLPDGAGIQLDFPIPANTQDQFAVLLWDDEDGDGNGKWLDVSQIVKDEDLSRILSADPKDELYHIVPTQTLQAFYRIISTEKTGTFVLVQK